MEQISAMLDQIRFDRVKKPGNLHERPQYTQYLLQLFAVLMNIW